MKQRTGRLLAPDASHLRKALEVLECSPETLATHIGVSDSAIRSWLRHEDKVPAWTKVAIEGLMRRSDYGKQALEAPSASERVVLVLRCPADKVDVVKAIANGLNATVTLVK